MEKIKTFDELTIQDNFLFQHVMRNERLCTYLIEKILDIKIRSLRYQDFEKTIDLRCTFDPFHKGLPIYTFTHCCKEDNKVQLKDEETRMFLNSKGSENAADPDIAAFLRYVDGKAAEGHFAERLDQEVHFVKSMDKVRREYMILSDEIRRRQREAEEEGLQKGLQEGRQEGRREGRQEERESNIVAMLKEKIPVETISRITHYSLDQIQELGKMHGLL